MMTPSEQLVFDLCRQSFLSLWSYVSPRRPDGRELCDVLVAFGKHIIIFSVKEITLKETEDPAVAAQRWVRKAIDDSVKQLVGALRELKTMTRVVRQDGGSGVDLPPVESRRIHLVAVAVGSNRTIPFAGGDKDANYVHVMDEIALRAILGELDTTPDFVNYLEAKESFCGKIICEGEENLLALYLHQGRKLPSNVDMLIVDGDLWSQVAIKSEFVARKSEDEISYWWDRTIETLVNDFEVRSEAGPSSSDHEKVVRTLATEDRFARRILSTAIIDWLKTGLTGARSMVSPMGVAYLFATYSRDYSRDERQADLGVRCFVARSPAALNCETVIGIATEVYDPSGYSLDAVYLHLPEWTEDDERSAWEARQKFGILQAPIYRHGSFDEFPLSVDPQSIRTEKNRKKRERRKHR